MSNLNVVVHGPSGFSKELGKRGTESDLTFYNLRQGEHTVTLVEPNRYPERLPPLFFAASMSSHALLVIEGLDHVLGEVLLMLDAVGVRSGTIILRNFLVREQVEPLLKGTVAESYEFVEDDMIVLRERLLTMASSIEPPRTDPKSPSKGSVQVDHHFNVKGVGTVVLGTVASGNVRKHDKLIVHPTSKEATLRSIQKHDDDFDEAFAGDRVGLALRGVDSEELDRGYVLSTDDGLMTTRRVDSEVTLNRFWKVPVKEDMVVHIGHWMQFIPCRVTSYGNGRMALDLEKELVHLPGDRCALMYLEGGRLRVMGHLGL